VSLAAGVVAGAGIAVCLRGARRELDDRTAPMAGLVAAFVFAVQMLNFPVAAGTSGHLLGGALAAILVGPYTGALCVAVVLLVQAVFFADGGLTALGVNVVNMSLVTAVVGYLIFRGLLKVLPQRKSSIVGAAFTAALVSVPLAALSFVGLYALGGTADVSLGAVLTAMLGVIRQELLAMTSAKSCCARPSSFSVAPCAATDAATAAVAAAWADCASASMRESRAPESSDCSSLSSRDARRA